MRHGRFLAAIAIAVTAVAAVLLGTTLGSLHHASANQPNANLEFTLHAGSGSSLGDSKDVTNIGVGNQFLVSVSLDAIPGPYDAIAVSLGYSGVIQGEFENSSKPGSGSRLSGNWPDCVFEGIAPPGPGFQNSACGVGISSAGSTYTGTVWSTTLTCVSSGAAEIHLVHGPADTLIIDHAGKTSTETGPDQININCVPVPPTPTPTPTSTPPAVPRVFKKPVLQNVFLQRQGAKIPPARCDDGTSLATLTEQISQTVATISPKGEPQTLAAFEFEVRFDPTKVCVNLTPTDNWSSNPAVICTVQDKDNSTLEGIARIGCVTIGKQPKPAGLTLATITVRPQPELFSQIRPNQDNGNVVQILNQGCELADEQGHAIPIFSCEDADITFRFLEGDVDGPDCDVDVFDTQAVAFRWGVNKGSLLFSSFLDLEPSGQVKGDGDIDIKDIQFVFGRFGSTCANPWPAQPPVNAKGGPTPSGQSTNTPPPTNTPVPPTNTPTATTCVIYC